MKPLLSLAVLALLALPAHADSTYDLDASAGFQVGSETIQVNYTYQVSLANNSYQTTDLSYSVFDSANNVWTLDYFTFGEFAVDDGPLQFAASLEACCDGINIDQEMYGVDGPVGALLPQFWSATPVAQQTSDPVPEPESLSLLAIGLFGLASLKRKVA